MLYSFTDNSQWGYYADGFFDRRRIVSGPSGTAGTAVASGNRDIALVGRLFFNPVAGSSHYNASIFFPAPGMRSTKGQLEFSGVNGYYWSASSISSAGLNSGMGVSLHSDYAVGNSYWHKGSGISIRPVVE